MAQSLEPVVRRFEVLVGHQQHGDALLQFDLGDFRALLIQQEAGHFDRHLHMDGSGVFLHRLFLNHAQDLQCAGFGVADVAGAVAARAGDVAAFGQCRAQALAAQLQQAELADAAELHPCTIRAQRLAQAGLDLAPVLRLFHVDEVDDDQATQVAQAHLARDLVGSFEVGAGRGFLDVAAARRTCGVDVDGHQRLGVVDHDRAARRQVDGARERRLDLVLDLEAAEQRRVVAVALDLVRCLRHHVGHELLSLIVDVVGVDQDLADIGGEVVADRTDHQRRFLVDQERTLARLGCAVDGGPQLEHVVQVPLQFGRGAADACRAGDQAHALRILELVEVFLQLFSVLTLDAARHTAAARVVRHQHQVAARQADHRRQRGALVAALFLLDLHQQRVAFADRVLDARGAHIDALAEIVARDFLERQEAVAVFSVVDETGLERRLDACHDRLVDVALALLAPFDLGFEVQQFLAVDDRKPAFFRLRRIDQHAFHGCSCAVDPGADGSINMPTPNGGADSSMHEKRQRAEKESPWTADDPGGRDRSVGACVSVVTAVPEDGRRAVRRKGAGAWASGAGLSHTFRPRQASKPAKAR